MKRLLAAALFAALVGLPAAAGADDVPPSDGAVTVAGEASASGVRFTYEVPAEFLAASTPVDGGGPLARATVGSGVARSSSSLPFPGDVVIAGPGLFYTVTGQTIPGSYPFYVAAEYPTAPESSLGDPTGQYKLSAKATERSATGLAQAVFGPPESGSGGSRTQAAVDAATDGSALSRAESVTQGLSFGGGALRIAAVRSTSETSLARGATEAVTRRSLSVEGVTVAGQAVTIDAGGVHAGSGSAPVPIAAGADQVSTALHQAGVSARVVKESDGHGGAVEFLEVQDRHPLPFAGNPQGTFSWRIGRVDTSLTRTGFLPAPAPDSEPAGGGGEATSQPTPPPALSSARSAAVTPPLEPAVAAPAGDAPDGTAAVTPARLLPAGYDPGPVTQVFDAAPAAPADGGAPGRPAARTVLAATSPAPVGLDRVRSLYGALTLGTLLLVGLGALWRRKGVSWRAS